MKPSPVHLPPEPVLRAYLDLLYQALVFLRGRAQTSQIEPNEVRALADALHNVPAMLLTYGEWTNDEQFRELYLRPFDRQWADHAFSQEKMLQRKIDEYQG